MAAQNDIVLELKELALATRLKRLSDRLMNDVGRIYKENGLDFEPRFFTITNLLHKHKQMSIVNIAEAAGITHPAVVQLANAMIKKGLIEERKDKLDGRKRILSLTNKGKKTFEKIKPLLGKIAKANREYIKETNVPVLNVLKRMEETLEKTSMYDRIIKK